MECPECGSDNLRVVDTRSTRNDVKRRRECNDCLWKFTTYEFYVQDECYKHHEVLESIKGDLEKYVGELRLLQQEMRDSLDNRSY